MPLPASPFAILDFPGASPRLFARPREVLVAERHDEVRRVFDAVDEAGLHAVGFVSYEAAPAFDAALVVRDRTPLPLAWFALFDTPSALHESLLPAAEAPRVWTPDIDCAEYDAAIAAIREGIACGDYYQVNHTLRLRARDVEPLALWQRLRRAQRGAYSAYIDLGRHAIVSASPELFFARERRRVMMRPMKGTATRGRWDDEDYARTQALASSDKERAENLMIVDLVRNDLGRVAEIGGVRATRLCDVERWPTVLQMTSTVEATLREGVAGRIVPINRALFPWHCWAERGHTIAHDARTEGPATCGSSHCSTATRGRLTDHEHSTERGQALEAGSGCPTRRQVNRERHFAVSALFPALHLACSAEAALRTSATARP